MLKPKLKRKKEEPKTKKTKDYITVAKQALQKLNDIIKDTSEDISKASCDFERITNGFKRAL